MKKQFTNFLLLVALLVSFGANAQVALSNYEVSTGVDPSLWITLSDNASQALGASQDDVASSLCNMGMDFTFCGTVYNQFSVNSNGNLKLGSTANTGQNYSIPFSSYNAAYNTPKIVGIGRDLGTGSNGYVRYESIMDDNGDSVLVVEFAEGYTYSSSNNADVKWQIQFHKNSGEVYIVYPATVPANCPSGFQIGASLSEVDVVTIDPGTHTATTGNTSSNYSTWPGANRYYKFAIPTCPTPGSINATAISSSDISIAWTENGSATSWETYCSSTPVTDFDAISAETATTESHTFYGLNSNTQYYIYVRANCGSEYSNWSAPLVITTSCAGFTSIPYFQDFENLATGELPNCWVNFQTGTSSSGTFPSAYAYSGNALNSQVYFELECSSGCTEVTALPEMDNISTLQLDFYLATSSSYLSTLEVGVMEGTNFVVVDTIDFSDCTVVGGGSAYKPKRVLFGNYTGTGNRIAIRASRPNGQMTVFIENLSVTYAPLCNTMPGSTSISAIDSANATLTWGAALGGGSYQIYESTTDDWYTTTDTFYTFTGLNANTVYSGRVYHICSTGDSSYSVPFSFRTECGSIQLPLYENFDTYQTDFPNCWHAYQTADGTYPHISTGSSYSGGSKMSLTSVPNGCSFTSPRVAQPLTGIETKFYAKVNNSNNNEYLYVGYTTNLNDLDAFVVVDSVVLHNDYREYVVSFANTGMTSDCYIVFHRNQASTAAYVDDITFRQATTCAEPTNFQITGTATGEMSFSWSDNAASSWEIAAGNVGFDPDTAVLTSIFSDTAATMTGLEDTITYDFYIRALCGSQYGYWHGPLTARPNLVAMTAGQSDTTHMCGGTIVDDGGLDGSMASNTTSYLVVYPSDEFNNVVLTGTCNMPGTYTYYTNTLTIYEGVGTSGRVLGTYTGNSNINVASSEGAVTIKTQTSYFGGPGFELTVSCLPMLSCNDPYDIAVSDIAGGSATVSWNYGTASTPSDFMITVLDTLQQGNPLVFMAPDSARSYQISGLDQTTTYYVTVTAVCGTGDESNPIGTYFTTTCFAGGVIQVGEGNVGLTSHPINPWYNYGCFQMLYNPDEITGIVDTVYGIRFFANSTPTTTRDITIYIDTTSLNTYNSGSDFRVMDSTKMVFSGNVTLTQGYNEFTFNTPWVRPNLTSSIVLTVDDNTGSYSSSANWAGTGNLAGKTLYHAADGLNVDPTVANSSLATTTNRPNTWFVCPCADANCIAPAVVMAGATANSATLNWVPGNNETSWTVEYKIDSDTAWSSFAASTTNTSATITGLFANTAYNFRVGSLCIGSADPVFGYANGRTGCDVMSRASLPYTENFDSYSTGDVPNCWLAVQSGTNGSYGPFPSCYNHGTQAHSGNVYFELEFDANNQPRYEIAALPEIDTIQGLMLDFWMSTASNYLETFEIGVMEDTTFVVVDTLDFSSCNGIGGSYYQHFTTYFTNYTGDGSRIAFRASKTSGQMTILIDDVTVDVAPTCIPPTNFSSTGTGATSVSLAWTAGANETEWEIAYDTMDFVPTATTTGITINSNPATISNLIAGQTYVFYLRASCGGGDYSSWVGPVSATTNTWVMRPGYADTITMCGGRIYDAGGANGNYGASANDILVIYPDGQGLAAVITGQYNLENGYDHLYVYDGVGVNGTELADLTGSGTANIHATDPTGALTLKLTSDNVVQYSGFDFVVSCVSNTCPAVADLVASSTTSTTIDVSWTAGNGTSWIVECDADGQAQGTGIIATANVSNYTFTGLTPATPYTIYVTPVCAVGDTGFTASATVTTSCFDGAISVFPWVEEFDSPASLSCWSQEFISNDIEWSSVTYADGSITPRSGTGFAHIDYYGHGRATRLISPMLSINPGSPATLTFAHAQPDWYGDHDSLRVVYRTSPDAEWTLLQSYTNSIDTWRVDTLLLTNVSSTFQIAFEGYMEYGYGVDIDSVAIDGLGSGCAAPRATVTTVDYESATITWTGSADSYEVSYTEHGNLNWSPAVSVTAAPYTFTGLLAGTEYDFRIRAVCDTNEFSGWGMGTFTTDSLPCFNVTNLSATAVTESGVTLAWNDNAQSNATAWVVNIFNTTTNIMDTVRSNPATISGLYDNTTYSVAVQSMCSALVYSDWSDTITFTTTTCQPVSNVVISNITTNGATVTWTAGANETSWEVSYGEMDFTEGNGTNVTVTSTSYTITGLESGWEYDVYVRAICGTGNTSDWSAKKQFTTTAGQGIDGVEGNYSLSIYPNPASGNTTISLRGVEGEVEISVMDMNGRVISSETLNCGSDCVKSINVANLAQGTYFVRVLGDGISSVRKLIVR